MRNTESASGRASQKKMTGHNIYRERVRFLSKRTIRVDGAYVYITADFGGHHTKARLSIHDFSVNVTRESFRSRHFHNSIVILVGMISILISMFALQYFIPSYIFPALETPRSTGLYARLDFELIVIKNVLMTLVSLACLTPPIAYFVWSLRKYERCIYKDKKGDAILTLVRSGPDEKIFDSFVDSLNIRIQTVQEHGLIQNQRSIQNDSPLAIDIRRSEDTSSIRVYRERFPLLRDVTYKLFPDRILASGSQHGREVQFKHLYKDLMPNERQVWMRSPHYQYASALLSILFFLTVSIFGIFRAFSLPGEVSIDSQVILLALFLYMPAIWYFLWSLQRYRFVIFLARNGDVGLAIGCTDNDKRAFRGFIAQLNHRILERTKKI